MRVFTIVAGMNGDLVVCFHSEQLLDHLKSALKHNPGVSYQKITQEEAIKLLVEGNGIGVGCYVASGTSDADMLRATRARKNKVDFARKLNIPVFLHVERLEPSKKEREVLKLKH